MASPRRDGIFYGLLGSVLWVGGRLPLALTRPVCRRLVRAGLRFAARDRTRMAEHLAIAFPELDESQRRRLVKGCADHFGDMFAEVAWLRRAGAEDVRRMVDFEGLKHLARPVEKGRGVVLATGHAGNWELLNAAVGISQIPMSIAVRELKSPRMDEIITSLRARFGTEVIPRGASAGKKLLEALGRGRVVGLLIDQDIPTIPGVFVPFFGRPAWTPSGAAMIALRAGCDLVPGFIHRRPDGSHLVKFEAPLPVPSEGSLEDRVWALTAAVAARTEWQIRAWPEQWVWMHRRWRTQPDSDRAS
ncbi:MAG: lysophospholipid acyltransferase family protein [Thermoanaerobaculales bacterium]|jgi:KDO2-lipid IV(A) lauroyltransferase|nr:lysophospholipid acyltransferase family protein [Thermoanaerobaculales bacterium]